MKQFVLDNRNYIIIYLVAINLVAFIVYAIDKHKAKTHKWRIPEATLIFLAFLGGCIGALSGMKVFHHKTKKPKFKFGVPIIMALWIIAFGALMMYG